MGGSGAGKEEEEKRTSNEHRSIGLSRRKTGVSVLGLCGQKPGANSLSLILPFPDSSFFLLVKSDFTFYILSLYFPTHFYCLSVVS